MIGEVLNFFKSLAKNLLNFGKSFFIVNKPPISPLMLFLGNILSFLLCLYSIFIVYQLMDKNRSESLVNYFQNNNIKQRMLYFQEDQSSIYIKILVGVVVLIPLICLIFTPRINNSFMLFMATYNILYTTVLSYYNDKNNLILGYFLVLNIILLGFVWMHAYNMSPVKHPILFFIITGFLAFVASNTLFTWVFDNIDNPRTLYIYEHLFYSFFILIGLCWNIIVK